jgi:hypothetical protein
MRPDDFASVTEIIHAVLDDDGLIYSMPNESVFNGSGQRVLERTLTKCRYELEKLAHKEENVVTLNEWLGPIDNSIGALDQAISMSHFELPDYSLSEIENHNQFYGLAKTWLEGLKNLITQEPEEWDE